MHSLSFEAWQLAISLTEYRHIREKEGSTLSATRPDDNEISNVVLPVNEGPR
jgi:hypothetical protein